jgi:threonine aldolase
MKTIDLRSDTVTKPSPGMRKAMAEAEVGDDMLGEDPTVNRLEAMIAEMFNKEAAVFACSGTQSNQMAVRAHCQPGDELLIHETGHIAGWEAGGPAIISGVTTRCFSGEHGFLDLPLLEGQLRADDQHLCRSRLLCLENTTNGGGGRGYPLELINRLSNWARENDLKVHVDGARFFNAVASKGYSPAEATENVDSISLCLSKGLGCPMGAVLVGDAEFIKRARRARKLLGGALRQSGIVAAAGVYAMENNIQRLKQDHDNAKKLGELLSEIDGINIEPESVETNLVFFEIDAEHGLASQLSKALAEKNVLVGVFRSRRLRACTHLDITEKDVIRTAKLIQECLNEGISHHEGAAQGPYSRG